jgi:hypothetical protein
MQATRIERGRRLRGQRLGGDEPIVDARSRLELVQLATPSAFSPRSDADDSRAMRRERFRQDAAAAADVDDTLSFEATAYLLDPGKTKRIDLVQRAEHRTGGIPP